MEEDTQCQLVLETQVVPALIRKVSPHDAASLLCRPLMDPTSKQKVAPAAAGRAPPQCCVQLTRARACRAHPN